MQIITVEHDGCYYRVTSGAFDATMSRYLPSSPEELRKLCEERAELDYSRVTDVSTFIAMLADWDHNVDHDPLAVDSPFIRK